jgi:hypothetical protein
LWKLARDADHKSDDQAAISLMKFLTKDFLHNVQHVEAFVTIFCLGKVLSAPHGG